MYVFDPLMCDCEVCQSRRQNLPPAPELDCCWCGNYRLDILSGSITAVYTIECPECGLMTNGFIDKDGVHGLILAAEAWNRGDRYLF